MHKATRKYWDPLWDERNEQDWKDIIRACKKPTNWLIHAIDNNKNNVITIIAPLIENIEHFAFGRCVFWKNEIAFDILLKATSNEQKKTFLHELLPLAISRGYFQIMMRIYEECQQNLINWTSAFAMAVLKGRMNFLEAISGWAKYEIVEKCLLPSFHSIVTNCDRPTNIMAMKFVIRNREDIKRLLSPYGTVRTQFQEYCDKMENFLNKKQKPKDSGDS